MYTGNTSTTTSAPASLSSLSSLSGTASNNETDKSDLVTSLSEEISIPQPELTESSSEASCELSEEETNLDGYTHPLFESDHDPMKVDVYADVRDKMEQLARADRDKHFDSSKYVSKGRKKEKETHIEIPYFTAFTTYFGYAILISFGHIRDLCASIFGVGRFLPSENFPSDDSTKYAFLLKNLETFYTRRLYLNIQDVFNRPLASNPGATISVLERVSDDDDKNMKILGSATCQNDKLFEKAALPESFMKGEHTTVVDGRVARKCLNLASYNYLGFGDDWNSTCASSVLPMVESLPVSCSSPRLEVGNTTHHEELEYWVAKFIGKETCFVHNMGFNTNATTIPALVGKGDLLISDKLNHTSIVNGARASGASIRTFRHNDINHLEEIISSAIIMGRPKTRRPFKKIMVIVEGIYSMEGEYCRLGPINKICKKYGAYLYLDEAHSIGAFGRTGRGCCEYWGVDDVDIMMGTFSKSFGGMGGYVAGKKEAIDSIRLKCNGSIYHNSLSPIVCQQIITSLKIIMGKDGTTIGRQKIDALRDNSNYFRMRLTEMNLQVLGNYDSPVIPIMLYNPTKIAAFSRECYKRGIAVVVVGFPAVPVLLSRARFCISAAHTREDLDRALKEIEEVVDILKLRYNISSSWCQ